MLEAYEEVKNKKALHKLDHKMKARNRSHFAPNKASEVAEKLEDLGINSEKFK